MHNYIHRVNGAVRPGAAHMTVCAYNRLGLEDQFDKMLGTWRVCEITRVGCLDWQGCKPLTSLDDSKSVAAEAGWEIGTMVRFLQYCGINGDSESMALAFESTEWGTSACHHLAWTGCEYLLHNKLLLTTQHRAYNSPV